MEPAPELVTSRREWSAVAVATLAGGLLRVWPIGRLGLVHFDEGIYATVGGTAFSPGGIAPSLIPYAPPGYPILIGVASPFLGSVDGAAILVSAVEGTLTIPVVAWLALRVFGPRSGFAAAAFAAFSGPHVAFSRMALTDASFLLTWLIAVAAGSRFLDRPTFARALMLGLTVGLAQQFKYNGWLAGAIVAGLAGVDPLLRTEERAPGRIVRRLAWGAFAALIAAAVVWPWYRFVEARGGYAGLLRHQRSYLGGVDSWWPHFEIQADQAVALSGTNGLGLVAVLCVGAILMFLRRGWDRWFAPNCCLVALLFSDSPYWAGLLLLPWMLGGRSVAGRLAGVGWATMAVLTPFYHPYARLWLPFQALHWIAMGGIVALIPVVVADRIPRAIAGQLWLVAALAAGAWMSVRVHDRAGSQPDLLAPSDSVRRAAARIASVLPAEVPALLTLARPSVMYYLASRIPVLPIQNSDHLSRSGDPRFWVLVDSAILRSESARPGAGDDPAMIGRLLDHWEVVEEIETTLSLPTALDLDPGVARSRSSSRSAPLWLLRSRTSPRNPR